jgi:hypothetical protein
VNSNTQRPSPWIERSGSSGLRRGPAGVIVDAPISTATSRARRTCCLNVDHSDARSLQGCSRVFRFHAVADFRPWEATDGWRGWPRAVNAKRAPPATKERLRVPAAKHVCLSVSDVTLARVLRIAIVSEAFIVEDDAVAPGILVTDEVRRDDDTPYLRS